jgi:hypothetical protein
MTFSVWARPMARDMEVRLSSNAVATGLKKMVAL